MTPKTGAMPRSTASTPAQIQRWLKRNLFNGWFNSLLTLVCLAVITWIAIHLLRWATTQAQWAVVTTNLPLFFVGRYPVQQIWRVWAALAIALAMVGVWWQAGTWKQKNTQTAAGSPSSPLPSPSPQALFFILLLIAFCCILWLLAGGLGLPRVGTNLWGGLLLTLVVAITSIVLAFPFGVLLALGRQSSLPILQGFCTVYIELIRGLPLIGILFMAQVMLPLVLPGQPNIDRVVRAIAGLVLFNAAYLAENVRGGLQSIPRGQTEAAKALGLNPFLTLRLVVLPQALRIAIPGIVGQFISLFKDTSLLALFALLELTGIGRSILAQPQFLGRYAEVYLFVGLLYWVFCFTMSRISRRLERGSRG
ncbi:MAG: amino acid ABC transporter permease [Oscillatoriales cyanobacterium C42_A2020_001]|nr:amino acid ABC transporter permease [Leptolyngbyaceae cyanobacterium C42_A2020_001]